MPNELAPCPFCGASGAELVTYHEPGTVLHPWYRVECDHCGAKGPGTDRGTHREDWNRRAAATAPASRGMSYADRIANRLAQWKNWRPTTDAVAIAAEADAEIAALTATTNEAAAQPITTVMGLPVYEAAAQAALATQPVQAQALAWIDQETLDCLTKNTHGALAYHRWLSVGSPDEFRGRTIPIYAGHATAVDRGLSEARLRLLQSELDDWVKATGAIVHGSSWHCELSAMIDRAAALAASAPSQAEPVTQSQIHACVVDVEAACREYLEAVAAARISPAALQRCDAAEQALLRIVTQPHPLARKTPSQAGSCQASGEAKALALYEAIKHGDDVHREWLREALLAWFAGRPVPEARSAPPAGRTLTADEMLDLAECLRPVLKTPADWGLALQYARAILAASSTTAGERDHG